MAKCTWYDLFCYVKEQMEYRQTLKDTVENLVEKEEAKEEQQQDDEE